MLVRHAHLFTVWFLTWCAALLLRFQPALRYAHFSHPRLHARAEHAGEPESCGSESLNAVSKRFDPHQVKQMREENDLSELQAWNRAALGSCPWRAVEAEEEQGDGGRTGRAFREREENPDGAESGAQPAPLLQEAGNAQDFSAGTVLHG